MHATRIDYRPVFERWPHQGDYAAAWTDGSASSVTTRSEREILGIDSNRMGAKAIVLKGLRKRALLSPGLGRFGKYWLNARNAGLQSKGSAFALDDPLLGGGAPLI